MIKCPKCGKKISEFSVICPYCNNKIDNKIDNISDNKSDNISDESVNVKECRGWFGFESTKRDHNIILVLLLLYVLILLIRYGNYVFVLEYNYTNIYNIHYFTDIIGTVLLAVGFIKENKSTEKNGLNRIFTAGFGVLFIGSVFGVIRYISTFNSLVDLYSSLDWVRISLWRYAVLRSVARYIVVYICVSIMFLLLTINSLRKIKSIERFRKLKRISLLSVLICAVIYIAILIVYVINDGISYEIIWDHIVYILRLAALFIFCYNTKFSLDNEDEKDSEDLREDILM